MSFAFKPKNSLSKPQTWNSAVSSSNIQIQSPEKKKTDLKCQQGTAKNIVFWNICSCHYY